MGPRAIDRALAVTANGEGPSLSQNNTYNQARTSSGAPRGGQEVVERALAVTGPSLDAHHQARVFGAFLPAPQLLEAIQLLAALPDSFSWLDGFALMQELLDQFLHKTLKIEDVLERLGLQAGPVAFWVLRALAKSHSEKLLEAFLHLPF
ncbi:hypothetical protein lerEdw1_015466, partial [Lerista edwardsae]